MRPEFNNLPPEEPLIFSQAAIVPPRPDDPIVLPPNVQRIDSRR